MDDDGLERPRMSHTRSRSPKAITITADQITVGRVTPTTYDEDEWVLETLGPAKLGTLKLAAADEDEAVIEAEDLLRDRLRGVDIDGGGY